MSLQLTPKQEKFCQCIVAGMSKKDSYFAAYNCNSDRTATNESNILLQRDDITQRIEELRKPVINHVRNTAISERQKKREFLWNMIKNATNDSDKLKAMDILNKMDSEYINHTVTEERKTPIADLDTDTLKKLTQ